MLIMYQRHLHKTRRFLREEHGGVETVSFVIWVPFVMGFFMLVADASYIMFNRSNMLRIVEDGNRMYSIGVLNSNLEAETAIRNALSPSADGELSTVDSFILMGMVRTEVTVPLADVDMFGIVARLLANGELSITASHFKEYIEV
ncbi:hypothetical protein SAMN05444004_10230 [Jannaschia faecimaris]|uniref:TadE-like protein n=1 Tax=Jannaschia faecimaris TaxID=1244108 RepID=A0A1H3KYJ9_9RHOB|nr:hypothetical protein [Jannaschia faecimaris]SDY57231.1 hypothetical protein SAMN05444004_10230 [Jannaschia faecimaris]